jgi:hypothetical protein
MRASMTVGSLQCARCGRRANGAPPFGEIVTLSSDGPAVYPVLAATDKGLVAVWTASGDPSRVEVRAITMLDLRP